MKQKPLELTTAEQKLWSTIYDRAHLVLADERVEEPTRDRIADRFAHETILVIRAAA